MLKIILFALLLASGCSFQERPVDLQHTPCSADWYSHVDSLLKVSDSQGHGPDLGSNEWRSAAEFKLKLRSVQNKPDIMSEAWCEYIDAKLPVN